MNDMGKRMLAICMVLASSQWAQSQRPCSDSNYRYFDFWLGKWEAFGLNGQKAGDSHISAILDSCVILEEWTSANSQQGLRYAGKSYNTYNKMTRQWQQTWVDNVGGSTAFLKGKAEPGKIVFETHPFPFRPDSMAIRRLSFFQLSKDKVRQLGEISKDDGKTWIREYDLEYRRRKT